MSPVHPRAGIGNFQRTKSEEGQPMESAEIIFEVTEAAEGGYDARALGHGIFTQGEDWADLKTMVRDAVLCHFDANNLPKVIRLHLVKDEAIAV